MIPSKTWFPTSLQDRAAWFDNFSVQFSLIGASLGFTALEIAAVQDDNTCFQGVASGAVALDAYASAVRTYRKTVTEGNIGEPTPAFPASPVITPAELAATGIFQRLDELVARIRVAPAYTPEIGALLGIIPQSTTRPAPEDMQPELKVSTLPGSVVQVKFVRGTTNGIVVETNLDNSGTWNSVGVYAASPAVISIPENAQNLPRAVQLRARYVEGNSPVGQFSDITTVSTQPSA